MGSVRGDNFVRSSITKEVQRGWGGVIEGGGESLWSDVPQSLDRGHLAQLESRDEDAGLSPDQANNHY